MTLNANSIVKHVIRIKNGITKHVNENAKVFISAKKDYSWNPSTITIYQNSKYFKKYC